MLGKRKGIIICGFAGIGKTSFPDFVPYYQSTKYFDLPSTFFRKEEGWQKLYVDCAEAFADKYDYIFVSTHDMVIDELIRRRNNFYIVYPRKQCKQEYMERFIKRGSPTDYIERFMKNWDNFVDKLDKVNCKNKISLRTGQYLSDVISRIR